MQRFAQKIYVESGLRTPFGRGGGALAAAAHAMPSGAWAIVSVCADGGHGTVSLLRRP
ncbi:hypothetical protein [Sphingopyxis sp.]|uniref:hypothetical protein n=1 Tax=Sphingopyxis sp. TaxID=1908224 RepID=UPI003BA94257